MVFPSETQSVRALAPPVSKVGLPHVLRGLLKFWPLHSHQRKESRGGGAWAHSSAREAGDHASSLNMGVLVAGQEGSPALGAVRGPHHTCLPLAPTPESPVPSAHQPHSHADQHPHRAVSESVSAVTHKDAAWHFQARKLGF